MAGTVSYSVDNDRKFREALQKATTEIGNLTVPLTMISKDFYKSEAAIFNLKGPGQYPPFKGTVATSSLGGKGNALGRRRSVNVSGESEYQKQKIKKWGFDYPLLKASGALMNSVTDPTDNNALHAILGGQRLVIGTRIEYGQFHQTGTKNMAMRKFLFIGPEAPTFATSEQMGRIQRWLGILDSFVAQKLSKVGKISPKGAT